MLKKRHRLWYLSLLWVVSITLWYAAYKTQIPSLGMICKMIANITLMMSAVFAFLTFLPGPVHEIYTRLVRSPIAISICVAGIAIGAAICSVAVLNLINT